MYCHGKDIQITVAVQIAGKCGAGTLQPARQQPFRKGGLRTTAVLVPQQIVALGAGGLTPQTICHPATCYSLQFPYWWW